MKMLAWKKGILSAVLALSVGALGACSSAETEAAEATVTAEAAAPAVATAELPTISVYKSPTCGCCTKWEDHLREHGFTVESHETTEMTAVKVAQGVPAAGASCHTGVVDGYTIEGHVPADVIQRLLRERPAVAGLAVPGMPMGSPGMEGLRKDAYDVYTFTKEGEMQVYESR